MIDRPGFGVHTSGVQKWRFTHCNRLHDSVHHSSTVADQPQRVLIHKDMLR
jgi:hypothetical protein